MLTIEHATKEETVVELMNVNNVPCYLCESQSYGVFFKLKNTPIIITVDVYGDNELELSESEIIQRGIDSLIATQRHLTSDDLEFEYIDVYNKQYAPIENVYKTQSYFVKYYTKGGDISFSIKVEFTNQKRLTEDEIIAVANDQLKQYGKIQGEYYFEDISIDTLIEAPKPLFPFSNSVYPDGGI